MIGAAPAPRRSALARLTLLVISLLISPCWTGGARAQATRELVAEVSVVGNQRTPTQTILTYIRTRPNAEYDYARVMDDVTELTKTHLFRNVSVRQESTSDGRVHVIFVVQEHPNIVREVLFKHAKHISDKELQNITRVRAGMPLDKTLNALAQQEITEYYKRKGRFFANVTLEEGYDERHNRVVFNITEGPVVKIRSIDFVGNRELANSARLRLTQMDSGKAYFGILGGTFQPMLLDNDMAKLAEYYRANGYLNVKVQRELKFTDDFNYVDVLIHIHEGERFLVKDYTIEGSKTFPAEELRGIVQVKQGDFYNQGVVTADARNITDYGGWRGYPLKVDPHVTSIPDEPGVVRVQYVIDERMPAKVGRVIIVGNQVTQDRVIRRVLGLYPGQDLRFPELREGERNLARLNIFETNPELGIRPTVSVLDMENPSIFKDVLVQVKETHTGSLMLGAGINSDSGVVGSIVLNERNFDLFRVPTSWADVFEGRAFRGAGQDFRIEAVPGNQLQRYTISLREPFLFDRPISLTTSGYYYDRVFNEYTEGRYGGRFTLGHMLNFPELPWLRTLTASGGLRVENINVSNVEPGAPSDYTSVIGSHFLVAPKVGLTWDTRDSYLRPTEGAIVDASYEHAFGDFNFPILNLEASQFFTVAKRMDGSGKHVVALRSQVSWAGDDVPVYERFFAGGFRSLRGFQFRGVGPNTNGFMTGGNFMFLNSIEYQLPVRANDSLYLVAFVDSGTVEQGVDLSNYRVSAGLGVRITVPMFGPVPIALDFGVPINRSPSDQTQLVAFWFGMYR